ncbi:uncharacterized protein LOC134224937 [Armigeres subalbatus]|uniref:uncharacterized protein LOC134224937 n=1 Tax=Armigeres subalbatus TaxID=124917 RepID=UPI002ED623BF
MEIFPELGNSIFFSRFTEGSGYEREIAINAVLRDNEKRFFINLCLDHPELGAESRLMAYHFGIEFADEGRQYKVIESGACSNGERSVHYAEVSNDGIVNIVFRLDEDNIKVYYEDTQHSPDYECHLPPTIDGTRIVEIRGDINHVEEFQLKYNILPVDA